jgi:hypothetical protein
MDRTTGNAAKGLPTGSRNLGLGSSFAAGALMLCHMNSSGLGRYEQLMADLSRFNNAPLPQPRRRVADSKLRAQPVRARLFGWFSRGA